MVFVQNQVPAVAITSHVLFDLMREITHTEKDVPQLVDPAKLAVAALALRDLTYELDGHLSTIPRR
jgi:aminopeptidase YwaD